MSNKDYNNAIVNYGNNAIKSGEVWKQGGKDNCAAGNAFEVVAKQVCIGNRFKGVSKGKTDVHFCGRHHEIKTNSGSYGNFFSADYVIYCIIEKTDELTHDFALDFSNVIPAQEFIEFLESDKRNTKMNGNRKMIQNIANPRLKERIQDFVWSYPSLREYLDELEVEGLR